MVNLAVLGCVSESDAVRGSREENLRNWIGMNQTTQGKRLQPSPEF